MVLQAGRPLPIPIHILAVAQAHGVVRAQTVKYIVDDFPVHQIR